MAEQEMLLDSATIKAAVAGEKWATEKVIEHYAPMIDELAVDEDMIDYETVGSPAEFPDGAGIKAKKQRRTQRPYSPRARRFVMFYLLVCEMELVRLKVGVGHGVQLGKGLAGQCRHFPVHIRQRGMELRHRPAPVSIVIQTDQVFFLHIKLHCHTSNSFFLVRAGAFFGAWACLFSESCFRMEARGRRTSLSRFSSLPIMANIPCLSLMPVKTSDL